MSQTSSAGGRLYLPAKDELLEGPSSTELVLTDCRPVRSAAGHKVSAIPAEAEAVDVMNGFSGADTTFDVFQSQG